MQVAAPSGTIVLQQPTPHHPNLTTGTEAMHIRVLLGGAVAALRALFEGGCLEANAELAPQGRPGRIAAYHVGAEVRYRTGDPAMDGRFIALFVAVPAADGHIFGGAYVNSSRTRPSIYLVPRILDGAACWTVSATGTLFTARVARDLFAGVFGDDIEAGTRIAPLAGYDLFQTPWS